MRRWNIIVGRRMAYLRSTRKWTQEILAARLQCEGVDISREGVARIELGHVRVDEEVILGLLKVFEVPIARLFPKEIQDLDAKFTARAARLKNHSRNAKS
jgi:transcriptional regulator with XRE-family HTH domain